MKLKINTSYDIDIIIIIFKSASNVNVYFVLNLNLGSHPSNSLWTKVYIVCQTYVCMQMKTNIFKYLWVTKSVILFSSVCNLCGSNYKNVFFDQNEKCI